jgi:DNA-binding NtrC family response regulator
VKSPLRFLIVDENADSRFLLVKTLLRKFPEAVLQECHDFNTAVSTAQTDKLTAIVAHRTYDCDGINLVSALRKANTAVPIVMVSGIDRTPQALAAGANAFLNYDEWLRIGTLVSDVIEKPQETVPPGAGSESDSGNASPPAPDKDPHAV